MLDLGWTEILLIAVVTLIVVGPKELPNVLRTVSYWIRRARGLARDFQKGVDDIVREAELDDIKKELKNVSPGDMSKRIEDAVDPTGEIKDAFKLDKPDTSKPAKPATPKSGTVKSDTPKPDTPKIEAPSETTADTPLASDASAPVSPAPEPASTGGPDDGDASPPDAKSRASA
ncbi:MAG: Sec-independent protein translocase protein TatB [Proteobacteria bacterium]|nr:Sec-independent protein translocase protein TatB [Pseudomonadota bacterium]